MFCMVKKRLKIAVLDSQFAVRLRCSPTPNSQPKGPENLLCPAAVSRPVGNGLPYQLAYVSGSLVHPRSLKSDPVTDPEWPRGWVEVKLYSSMTAALEGGEWSAARPGRTLPPEKTQYPFYRRLGGSQGRSGRAENLVPTGIRSRTVQPIVSRYTD